MVVEIKVDAQGNFCLLGDLNFSNVPEIEKFGYKHIDKSDVAIFDLQRVASSDNSSLSLLTAWVRYAKRQKKNLRFIHCSKQLLDMARVSSLIDLLPIVEDETFSSN